MSVQRADGLGRRTRAFHKSAAIYAVLIAAALLVAACGGSGNRASTGGGSGSSSSTKASAASGGIRGQLLSGNEFTGFTSAGVTVYTTISKWTSGSNDQQTPHEAAAERAMLNREGFRAGAVENLSSSSGNDDGLSLVEQLRSPAAARNALAFYISRQKNPDVEASDGTYASFNVRGVPGAVGYSLGGSQGGINIAFVHGDYYLLVGREGGSPSDMAGLIAAAQRLYRRAAG